MPGDPNAPSLWSSTLSTKGRQYTCTAIRKQAAAAAAAAQALAEAGITSQVEPTRALALEERHQVAQVAADRLARTTSQTGGTLM